MLLARLFQTVFILSLLGILLVLFQAGATSAGQVIFSQDYRAPGSNQAITFDKPDTLKVFQANLQAGRPDYYAFQGSQEAVLKVKLDTLRLVGQDDFQPSLALFGPGLPPPTPDEAKLFPYSLPPGNGLLISAESGQPTGTGPTTPPATRFDEPWTQAGYWERQGILNQLPESGPYFLVVYSLDNQSGKYALFVGDKPEVGWRETLTFPITWARLHYWFDDLWWPTFAQALVGLALLALIYLYGRLVGRQYRVMRLARGNKRRAALLKKKPQPDWQSRRINRKPAIKALSSGVMSARLLTQTALRPAFNRQAPAATPPPAGQKAELLAASRGSPGEPAFKWELLETPVPSSTPDLTASNGSANLPGQNGKTEVDKATSGEDGLARWGQRFRP